MDHPLHKKLLFYQPQKDGIILQDILEKPFTGANRSAASCLGLSEQDEKRLVVEVEFVIHSIASISFFAHVSTFLKQYGVRMRLRTLDTARLIRGAM